MKLLTSVKKLDSFRYVVCLLFFVFFVSSYAESIERFSSDIVAKRQDVLSYEEYLKLIQLKVSQIKELENLWINEREMIKNGQNVYFAGGGLRGLLQWVDLQLIDKSIGEVRIMSPPTIDELIQEGADKDLFLEGISPSGFKRKFGYKNWDILGNKFISASKKAGGSTIEKVGISPNFIKDPYEALKDYYNGRLSYFESSDIDFFYFRSNFLALKYNSKIALVLRHLRFLIQFESVEVSSSDLKLLKKVVNQEAEYLQKGNYWVQKSLKKLFITLKENGDFLLGNGRSHRDLFVDLLEDTGLLLPLAKNNYTFYENESVQSLVLDRRSIKSNKSIFNRNIISKVKEKIEMATTVDEFYSAFYLPSDSLKGNDLREVRRLFIENINKLFELNPNFEELNNGKLIIGASIASNIIIIEKQIELAVTEEDFLRSFDPGIKNINEKYKDAIRKTAIKYFDSFKKLNPSKFNLKMYRLLMEGNGISHLNECVNSFKSLF